MQKILNYLLAIALIVSLTFAGVQSYRLECYREQCNTYREQLELAADRQSGIAANVERAGTILSSTINTTQELRKQIREVREIFEAMENLLNRDNFDNNNDNNIMENK